MDDEFFRLGVLALDRLLDRREVSSEVLTRAALRRIKELDGELGAFATVCAGLALNQARKMDREIRVSRRRTPLHGIPVAVKDLAEIDGLPLRAGSAVLDGYVSGRDAAHVTRLKIAGAVILGKTNLDEFAFNTTGPGMVNPLAHGRTVGGSSGGSAVAVAAGMCPVATGTDTGGSIRIPAACCGVVGLKPTFGVVDVRGVIPLARSLDHIGPIGRRVSDVRAMLSVLADPRLVPTHRDRSRSGDGTVAEETVPLHGLRLGIPDEQYMASIVAPVRRSFAAAVDALVHLGAAPVTVQLPDPDQAMHFHSVIVLAEAATYHLKRFGTRSEYGPAVGSAIRAGAEIKALDYLDAQRARAMAIRLVDAAFEVADVLALPTLAIEPPPVGAVTVALGDGRQVDIVPAMIRLTFIFDHSGHPAISIPMRTGGLPAGLQLVGRRHDDQRLLDVAEAYEISHPQTQA